MILTEFDEADAIKTWRNDGYEDGLSQGREEGEQKKAEETAKAMLADKLPPDKVVQYIGLPLEKVLKLQKMKNSGVII